MQTLKLIKVMFYIPKVINNTTRFSPPSIEVKAYNKDESIFPVHTIVECIKATEKI